MYAEEGDVVYVDAFVSRNSFWGGGECGIFLHSRPAKRDSEVELRNSRLFLLRSKASFAQANPRVLISYSHSQKITFVPMV